MRENRTCGSEGGEAQSLPYPYPGQRSSLNTLVNHYTNRPQAAPHMPNNHAQKTPITPKFHQPKFRSTEMAIQRHINAFNDGLRRLPHGGRDARAPRTALNLKCVNQPLYQSAAGRHKLAKQPPTTTRTKHFTR